jgi:hypothetical protein
MTRQLLALLLTIGFIPLGIPSETRNQTYFLTATFNGQWPSRLYRVSSQKTLEQIQEMAAASEGAESVLDGGPYISLLSPAITPGKLTVIDKTAPLHARVQTFSLGNNGFLSTPLLHLAAQNRHYHQILPVMVPPTEIATKQISIAPALSPAEDCSPEIYKSVYVDGNPGGPQDPSYIFGVARPDGMYAQIGKTQIRIDMQQQKSPLATGTRFVVIAATPQFLVTGLVNWDPKHLEENPKVSVYSVHDKEHNLWRTITVPGNSPIERLFGSWLATSEMSASPENHSRNNPGHDAERNYKTIILPNVQNTFANYIGRDRYIPGRLTLTNLTNGDQITLETGAEDSEILGFLGNNVMYRINDSIFQATVLEKSLGPAELIVRDEDVPEVHWIFEAQ